MSQPTPATASVGAPTTASATAPLSVSLGLFVIPLGISGLAGTWTAAHTTVGATEWVSDVLWVLCAVVWAAFTVLYAIQRLRHPRIFGNDLRHPIFGPFAANIPLIGVLLMTHFGQYLPGLAPWLVWLLVAASLLVAAQLFTHWLTGGLTLAYLRPGYFLPVVAAAFVSSLGLSSVGAHDAAVAAFAIGIFFWLVIGTIVTGRLITSGALPDAIKPTLSVLLVPPAVGGVAWLFLTGGHADPVGFGFIGVLCILLLVQLLLVPQYIKLPISLSLWTFTFPMAAAANFTIRWFAASPFPGSIVLSWIVLAVSTVGIVAIAALMLVPVITRRHHLEGKHR